MRRITGPVGRLDLDKFGFGKNGLTNGDPALLPPKLATEVTEDFLNDIQEEIASPIENEGVALDDDNQQLWHTMGGRQDRLSFANSKVFLGDVSVNEIHGIAEGDGQWVFVGDDGDIFRADEGVDLSVIQYDQSPATPANPQLNAVAIQPDGLKVRIAVGEGGAVATSPDAATWTPRVSGTTEDLLGVAYGNSLFVAVGTAGKIITSPDSIVWTSRTSGTAQFLNGIAYNAVAGKWVAVGGNGVVTSSSDGITWVADTLATGGELWRTVASRVEDGQTVILGRAGWVAYGTSGTSWTIFQIASSGTNGPDMRGVAFTRAGLAVAVGRPSTDADPGTIQYSSLDGGRTWSQHAPDDPTEEMNAIAVSTASIDERWSSNQAIFAGDSQWILKSLRM